MQIPEDYTKLLRDKGSTILSVVAIDGTVQSSLVWSDYEDDVISINMSNNTPKYKRIMRNKKATVLKFDPKDEDKYISIRCSLLRVESEDAIAHLDKLTMRHLGKEKWYGDVMPDNDEEKKRSVIVYLKPDKIYFT
jgi:Pyridoxamine 5'-phosphate oxidase